MMRYKKVAVGGTFDELHSGHKALLGRAFEVGERVVIGLTSDAFVARIRKPHRTALFADRCRGLEVYLAEQRVLERVEIVALNDPYGLTLLVRDIDALIVSVDTLGMGQLINQKRRARGYSSLVLVVVDMVPAQNYGVISTTRIRRGEIDHSGRILSRVI
ncbi:MAG: pantetheine-phosphate adenylyltransferase [Nitrososphaerota archaeon]|jgi:pantetheine-phosphate adenylyltransferase|nr:pantetheine-phosphate adenylyltransferase [Nitrososphaerota archaeon]